MSQNSENKSGHTGGMARDKDLILVVDDSPTNLAIMNVVLRDIYQVMTANNGNDALALAASEEPDLIILDIMMPGMDGYEICDRLKANPFTRDIPVMFVTAMDQERQEARGLAGRRVRDALGDHAGLRVGAEVAAHHALGTDVQRKQQRQRQAGPALGAWSCAACQQPQRAVEKTEPDGHGGRLCPAGVNGLIVKLHVGKRGTSSGDAARLDLGCSERRKAQP